MNLILLIFLIGLDNKTESIGLKSENILFCSVFYGADTRQTNFFTSSYTGYNYLINASSESEYKKNTQPTKINYLIEGLSGYAGGITALVLSYPLLIAEGVSGNNAEKLIVATIYSATTLGSSICVTFSGKLMKQKGSFIKSIGGATIVWAGGLLTGYMSNNWVFATPFALFVPMGAVMGYNW